MVINECFKLDEMTTIAPEKLPNNVHISVKAPCVPYKCVTGAYAYYHYLCDEVDDRGWGCGYRTLQTLSSSLYYRNKSALDEMKNRNTPVSVPSILDIQKALVSMKDKQSSFVNSREWIGSFEIGLCVDYFFDVPCKIHHIRTGEELYSGLHILWKHYEEFGSPVMMGGDTDAASKCILGICGEAKSNCHVLVLDPHCSSKLVTVETLLNEHWLSWRNLDTFVKSSFYNLCLPQCKLVGLENSN